MDKFPTLSVSQLFFSSAKHKYQDIYCSASIPCTHFLKHARGRQGGRGGRWKGVRMHTMQRQQTESFQSGRSSNIQGVFITTPMTCAPQEVLLQVSLGTGIRGRKVAREGRQSLSMKYSRTQHSNLVSWALSTFNFAKWNPRLRVEARYRVDHEIGKRGPCDCDPVWLQSPCSDYPGVPRCLCRVWNARKSFNRLWQ